MGMGQGRVVVLADGKILKPPYPRQHGQLMVDFHIFIAAVQPVFQMGFRQVAFKRSYLKIFQQRFRMQVRLVGKLGITENSRTYIGIISRLHIAVTFPGRPHQGTEAVQAGILIHAQVLQPSDLRL